MADITAEPRPIIEVGPMDFHVTLRVGSRYAYRGLLIVTDTDGLGAEVKDPEDEDRDIGWGSTMFQAMSVANEFVDGFERVPAADRQAGRNALRGDRVGPNRHDQDERGFQPR